MRASLSGVVLLGVAACSIDPGPQPNEEEPAPSEPRTLVAPAEVVAVPNLDDDDGDGVSDWDPKRGLISTRNYGMMNMKYMQLMAIS